MTPSRTQMLAALDDAFHQHMVELFEFAANNASISPTDGTRAGAGLTRAILEYQTFTGLIEKATTERSVTTKET